MASMVPAAVQQPQAQPQGQLTNERAQQMGAALGDLGFPPDLIQRLSENPLAQSAPESIFHMLMAIFGGGEQQLQQTPAQQVPAQQAPVQQAPAQPVY